ncbi:hypothetical protein LWI29_034992 [Acer saccharum]|uniref:Uncharacterized protein n=1 Tax=Acer saccharum TaxID=4024 RepID=A0AA39VD55_ACESA|nr:hypothetical protein LWI29_034992 [Acer saccharum]
MVRVAQSWTEFLLELGLTLLRIESLAGLVFPGTGSIVGLVPFGTESLMDRVPPGIGPLADRLQNYEQVMLPGVIGPESIAFDCHGKGPYVGVSDGRILKWQGSPPGWTQFAITSSNRQDLQTILI